MRCVICDRERREKGQGREGEGGREKERERETETEGAVYVYKETRERVHNITTFTRTQHHKQIKREKTNDLLT